MDPIGPGESRRSRLLELANLFLHLGFTSFGGPATHNARMHDEVVQRRKWLSDAQFMDLMSAANLIPGPNSTEVAIHIGALRAGGWGMVLAGTCFILPSMLLVLGLAALYVAYGSLPQAGWLLYGINPVVIAIVLQALLSLGKKTLPDFTAWGIFLAAAGLYFLNVNPLLLMLLAGGGLMLWRNAYKLRLPAASAFILPALPAIETPAQPFSLWLLFLTFLKIGSVLYGSGYVLLAFLQADFVDRLGWLTQKQLLDSVAVGQFTPGPVFTTATFIGYLLGGTPGAILATVGIFLPSFIFVALSSPLVPRLRASPWAGAFLDGVNPASLGLMTAVMIELSRAALVDLPTVLLALASAVLLLRFKLNSTWLILAGALAGWLLRY